MTRTEGMFTMADINKIAEIKDLARAKAAATAIIDGSTATDENKRKAMRMVHAARTCANLLIGMSNFNLAHQGMRVS